MLDAGGRYTQAGAEVRAYAAGTRKLLGTGIVDTGSGYCSQNMLPVHIGLPTDGRIDVEVTAMTPAGRKVTRVANVTPGEGTGACPGCESAVEGSDPRDRPVSECEAVAFPASRHY